MKVTRRANAIIQQYEESWMPHHQDIMRHVRPRRGRWIGDLPNRGHKKPDYAINPVAMEANRITTAGMHGGLTNPSWPWFKLGIQGVRLSDLESVSARWLHGVEEGMYAVYAGSNLYQALPSVYSELTAVATGALMTMTDPNKILRTQALTVGTYGLATGPDREVDTVVREFYATTGQLVRQFGKENVSHRTLHAYEENRTEEWVQVRHMIEPNDDRIEERIGWEGMKWRSFWWEVESQDDEDKWLRQKGYDQFPLMAPRWEVTEEDAYGSDCPGMMAIGAIRGLQKQEITKGSALELMIKPPLDIPSAHRAGGVSLAPLALNYTDPGSTRGIRPILTFVPPLAEMQADINRVEAQINRAFFSDLFITIIQGQDDPRKTATEIIAIQAEKLLMLGPVIERVFDNLLSPLIARTYSMMDEAGMIPEPPAELQDRGINVEFISTLAQAQKSVGLVSIERFVGFIGNLAGVQPSIIDVPDFDAIAEEYGTLLHINPKLITDRRARQELRAGREQMQRAAAMAGPAKEGAQAAKLLSETELSDPSVLKQILDGAGAGLPT